MWLYVPATSSPSAQASEALNSASCSPSIIGERLAEASATWRGKPQLPQAWSRRWTRGGFIQRLSGLTCSPSTASHGVASFISSLRETPARRTASPESAPAPKASASSPRRSPASQRSAGLILSSARTSRGTHTSNSRPSLHHWKAWATALRQEYSARPRPATPCGASDCSSWPSAKVTSGSWERDKNGNVYQTLEGAARLWPGPDATNRVRDEETLAKCAAFRLRNAGQKTVPLYLAEAAQNWSPQWPAPMSRDHRSGYSQKSDEELWGTKGLPLERVAVQHFLPLSSPTQPTADGSTCSTASPNSNQPSAKRKLNPIFVEALMRWPTGLSGFERQETAWTRWWLLMPSFLSALCSVADTASGRQPDLFEAA